jgi:DNA repair exonuclease SbcCD nuclease subunit
MLSILHAADLHLGLRITRFDPATAGKVREARFAALENLLKVVQDRKVDMVVVAGDLFDDPEVDATTARRAFLMLDSLRAPVYVLPGNHDPLLGGGVWDRPPWNQPGQRVRLLRLAEEVEVAPGALLLPCPCLRKTSSSDPTAWIARVPRSGTALRIGVAHGSLKVRDDLPPDDHLIARHAAADLQLDYLALGHWHSPRQYPDKEGVVRTAYPGVHEPMRFPGSADGRTGWVPYSGAGDDFLDAGRGEVFLVRLRDPGTPPEVEPVEVGHFHWQDEKHTLASENDLSQLIADVAGRPHVERRLLRLQLAGVLEAAGMLRLDELRGVLTRYQLGDLDLAGLHVRPTEGEMGKVAGDGVLRRVLDRLQAEAAGDDPAARQVAERAVLLLYQIAREVSA